MDKKNTMLLTVIAVATLLVAVVGATFAYFTAQNSATGTTNVTTTTEKVGAVVVSNPTGAMHLNLNASQMAVDNKNTSYYATAGSNNFSETKEDAVIARLSVTGGTNTTKYATTFSIKVDKSDKVLENDAKVVFTLAAGVEMEGVVSGEEIDYASLSSTYNVNYTQVGNTTTAVDLVKVAVKFNNRDAEQDYLAGETLTTSFTNNNDLSVGVSENSETE